MQCAKAGKLVQELGLLHCRLEAAEIWEGRAYPTPFPGCGQSISNVLAAVGNVGRQPAAELKLLCFTGAACAHDGA